jgi:hypothetical protein
MPVGDRQPVELLMDNAAWAREPARLAEELGHAVGWDPCRQERWTCRTCGRAVIRVGCNIYGSAVRERCEEVRGG